VQTVIHDNPTTAKIPKSAILNTNIFDKVEVSSGLGRKNRITRILTKVK
jgi:hypothetical protein